MNEYKFGNATIIVTRSRGTEEERAKREEETKRVLQTFGEKKE